MYETFEHTADIGLRARAPDLDGLFQDAAKALLEVIVANPEAIRPAAEIPVALEAARHDELLFDWLSELLYLIAARRWLPGQFEVRVAENRLAATVRGEPVDRTRHVVRQEVKAITYHGLKVQRNADGWVAEVIVDL